MKPISRVASSMPRSGIREVMELAARRANVIHLEVGEPDIKTPPHVIEAAFEAARAGFTGYAPNAGYGSLRELVADTVRRDLGISVSASGVVVTPGAVAALYSAIIALLDPGDEVLVPDPGWPNYTSAVLMAGGRPIPYRLSAKAAFQPDFEHLESLVTPNAKLLMTNSPGNPTGAVFSRQTVEELVAFIERHDLYLLSDEVYEKFVFDAEHISPARLIGCDRVVTVSGASKTYSMTGWRVGYALTNDRLAEVIAKLQEPFVSCASSISQKAVEAALLGSQESVRTLQKAYAARRDLLVQRTKDDGLVSVPRGAFYALIDITSSGLSSLGFTKKLLLEEDVAVAPGGTFGSQSEGMVRISFATAPNVLDEGLLRLQRFRKKLAS